MQRHQLQTAHVHEVVVVVVGGIASVAVEDAGVVSEQVFLLRPDIGEWFAPDLRADL